MNNSIVNQSLVPAPHFGKSDKSGLSISASRMKTIDLYVTLHTVFNYLNDYYLKPCRYYNFDEIYTDCRLKKFVSDGIKALKIRKDLAPHMLKDLKKMQSI